MAENNIPERTRRTSEKGTISSNSEFPIFKKFYVERSDEDSKIILRSKVNFKKREKLMSLHGMFKIAILII